MAVETLLALRFQRSFRLRFPVYSPLLASPGCCLSVSISFVFCMLAWVFVYMSGWDSCWFSCRSTSGSLQCDVSQPCLAFSGAAPRCGASMVLRRKYVLQKAHMHMCEHSEDRKPEHYNGARASTRCSLPATHAWGKAPKRPGGFSAPGCPGHDQNTSRAISPHSQGLGAPKTWHSGLQLKGVWASEGIVDEMPGMAGFRVQGFRCQFL